MNDVKINSNSIEEMYTKYYTSLKRHCIKLASYNPQFVSIAEDCVQEAFYRAVCHAEDFASSPNQYGWLATCCSHYMLSHIRQAKKREKIIGKSMSLDEYGDVPDLMDNILACSYRISGNSSGIHSNTIASGAEGIPCIL